MGLKCTSRVEVEITRDALLEFIKKRLEGTGKEMGDEVQFLVTGADGEVAEVKNDNPLRAYYMEISEV